MSYDPVLAERALIALSRHPAVRAEDLVEKKMFGGVSFLVGGAMTVGVLGEQLVVRVDPDEAEALLEAPHVRPMDFTGRPMKGWLYVHADAVADDDAMARWVGRSMAFISKKPAKKLAKKK